MKKHNLFYHGPKEGATNEDEDNDVAIEEGAGEGEE